MQRTFTVKALEAWGAVPEIELGAFVAIALAKPNANGVAISLNADADRCQTCKLNPAREMHACPYNEEINGDSRKVCNCCVSCQERCCEEI